MLWSTILFLLFSSVGSRSNWYNKVNIEKNGNNYINIYAFSNMEFTMETSEIQNFNFTIRKSNQEVIPLKIIFSTASSLTNVTCDINENDMECKRSTEPHDTVIYELSLKDEVIDVYKGYKRKRLNFLKEGTKYLLGISSNFSPVDDQNLCPFLMEWPSSVTLQETHQTRSKVEIPSYYEICEESEKCDALKNESGVKFSSKGILEFTVSLLDKEKVYKLLHVSEYNSPIYTIHGSTLCSEYTTIITFMDSGNILFKRDKEKMDIETEFKPISQNIRDIRLANNSDVKFYFFMNFIYCNFFNPEGGFQLRTIKLPEDLLKNKETNIQIDFKSTVKECNETLKIIVGNDVKLLFPKTVISTSTIELSNFTIAVNSTTKEDDSKTASFPLGATIAISCIGGILLLVCLALIIYCGIKKYKKRKNAKISPKKTTDLSISEMEKKILSKKRPKKSKKNKSKDGIEKKTTEEFSIIYGKPTDSFAPINVNGENEKSQQKNIQQKIEKMKKRYAAQENQEEKNTTEENGEEEDVKVPNKKTITKSKTVTVNETIEEGGAATKTTQNSVQTSKTLTSDDSKPRNKKSIIKTKTKTLDRNGTAPTQASVPAENPES